MYFIPIKLIYKHLKILKEIFKLLINFDLNLSLKAKIRY